MASSIFPDLLLREKLLTNKLALSLGINPRENGEKHKLIGRIKAMRSEPGLFQAQLAKKLKVTQGRVAQIESGIGTRTVSFDLVLHVLDTLGFDYTITPRKAA